MKEDIYHIASGYFKGTISDSDKVLLTRWLNESEENRVLFGELEKIWKLTGSVVQNVDVDIDAEWQRFSEAKSKLEDEDNVAKNRKVFAPVVWKIAAAVIPAVIIGSLFLLLNYKNTGWISVETANNIRTVELPDGSKVWVNKNSSLSYPKQFGSDKRIIKFTGEAFFEVSHSKKPFIVETGKVSVKVLGTRFNLRSFKNESTSELFLKEGKVLFSKADSPEVNITLTRGEAAVLSDSSNTVSKTTAELTNATAWLDHKLSFRNAPLTEISESLERYFNVQIVLPQQLQNCRFSGEFTKPQLYELLDVICLAIDCSYKTENNKFIFSGIGCN